MILLTGASQGIGFACAKALLERTPSEVMITGRSEARLRSARDGVPASCRERLLLRVCDQASASDVAALTVMLRDPRTALTGAILGVGVNPMYREGPQRLHRLAASTIDDTVRTNCTHTLLITAGILERLRKQAGGVLLWIGSQAPKAGLAGAALYCATKSFLSGLARAARNEYAGRGVRVQLLNPALVRTPRTVGVVDEFAAAHGLRVAEAEEIGNRIVDAYLSSDPGAAEVDL